MSFKSVFLASSYFLVLLGLIGLVFTQELSTPYLVLAGASFILAIAREVQGGKEILPRIVVNILITAVFILTLFSIFVLKTLPIQELVHFLLSLQAVKLLAPKRNRDWVQLYLLSFFSVVSASALSVELSFASIFILYLFAAPWVLVLFHLKGAMEGSGKDIERTPILSWSLFRLVGRINLFLLVLTLAFFVTFPRFRVGLFGDTWASGSVITGFSDRLSLGDVSEIKRNNAVAMRVNVDRPDLLKRKKLYWRGLSLDRFDGRKWERSRTSPIPIRRRGRNYLVAKQVHKGTPLIRQEIILEPTGSHAIFALGRPLMVSGGIHRLYRDPLGNLRSPYPLHFKIAYTAISALGSNNQGRPLGDNFLQLPAIDPRIVTLSRRVTEGINGDAEKARALERHLRDHYTYSLKNLPRGGDDPLARFLFDVRHGDCEYFSSALTVMLRSLGIPARVVNGYLGGEWNPYGEYYLIRQSNAHSWVEAYLGKQGWVTLDATPPTLAPSRIAILSSAANFIDFLRMRWYRFVVNFGFRDQYRLLTTLSRPSGWFDSEPRSLSFPGLRQWLTHKPAWWAISGMGGSLLLLVLVWLKRKRSGKGAYGKTLSHEATERYRRLLTLLRKRGFRKKAGETPDEFCRLVERNGSRLVSEFTSLYQQARFSPPNGHHVEIEKMDRILIEIGKGKGLGA